VNLISWGPPGEHLQKVLMMVLTEGWDSIAWTRGHTLFHHVAAHFNNLSLVELVGLLCTDLEKVDEYGKKPIDYARQNLSPDVLHLVEQLIQDRRSGRLPLSSVPLSNTKLHIGGRDHRDSNVARRPRSSSLRRCPSGSRSVQLSPPQQRALSPHARKPSQHKGDLGSVHQDSFVNLAGQIAWDNIAQEASQDCYFSEESAQVSRQTAPPACRRQSRFSSGPPTSGCCSIFGGRRTKDGSTSTSPAPPCASALAAAKRGGHAGHASMPSLLTARAAGCSAPPIKEVHFGGTSHIEYS